MTPSLVNPDIKVALEDVTALEKELALTEPEFIRLKAEIKRQAKVEDNGILYITFSV